MEKKFTNTAGAVTISNKGEVGIDFTAERMSWAYQQGRKVYSGISKGDNFCEDA
jgi:beta-aspartyl-peptidase (threonine type)